MAMSLESLAHRKFSACVDGLDLGVSVLAA